MALRGRMPRAAIEGAQGAPGRIVNIAGLQRTREAFRIGHRREIAVIGGADPAAARGIGAELTRAAIAHKRIRRTHDQALLERGAVRRKALAVERGILLRVRAEAMVREGALMAIDERHAIARGIVAKDAALA